MNPFNRIVTHPGQAHRDDFLTCCFLLAQEPDTVVERREPTNEELYDRSVAVVDVGKIHDADLNDFDHHHLPRDYPATCALSLMLTAMGKLELAHEVFGWLKFTEVLDSKGPSAAAELIGTDRDSLHATLSPIETSVLQMFGRESAIRPGMLLHNLMFAIGHDKVDYLNKVSDRLKDLDTRSDLSDDLTILDTRRVAAGHNDPTLGVEIWLRRHGLQDLVQITISNDDRGSGYCLFRRNDAPGVDFSRLEGHPDVIFAHKGGFVAKTEPGVDVEVLIRLARNTMDALC